MTLLMLAAIGFAQGALRAQDTVFTGSAASIQPTATAPEKVSSKPFKAELLVHYYDPEGRILWAETDGAIVQFSTGSTPLPVTAGSSYLFEGITVPSRGLEAERLTISKLPPKEPVRAHGVSSFADLANFNNQRVTVEGRVHGCHEADSERWRLYLVVDGRLVTCNVRHSSPTPSTWANGTLLQATGIIEYRRDPNGWSDTSVLWVGDSSQIVCTGLPESDNRFNFPATSIDRLPQQKDNEPCKVSGTVVRYIARQGVVVRDETGQVEVKSSQWASASVGERVDAVGYPRIDGTQWLLCQGYFRRAAAPESIESPTFGIRHRLVEQVLELPLHEVEQGAPVRFRGVVLWSAPGASFFMLKDPSGGICVQYGSWTGAPPPFSSEVVVEGATVPGAYSPAIKLSSLEIVGHSRPPEAKIVTLEQALTGAEENRWVEMSGYLRDVNFDGTTARLTLVASAGEFSAQLPAVPSLSLLQGAVVRIQGVCTATSNEDHQLTGINLLVPGSDFVQIAEPAPSDPYAVPLRSIASLHQYSTLEASSHRVRLSGVVLHQVAGRYLLIQDDSDGILVLSRSHETLLPGNCVEVVGFPGRESSRVVIREAIYRKTSSGREPSPLRLMNPELVNTALDVHLVNITGTLLDKSAGENRMTLIVQTRDRVFEAVIERRVSPNVSEEWLLGSQVRITGVYEVKLDEYRQPYAYQLLLRSPADVVIVTRPSWWTTERLLLATAVTCGCILLAVGWGETLRRRVKKQTAQIRVQLEKESHMEARYRNIFESASDFIFTIDLRGHFTSFNRSGEKMTGYSREEALQMDFRDLLVPEDVDKTLPFLGLKPGTPHPVTFQSRFRGRNGGFTWAETNLQLIYESGLPVGMLGVVRDINERKQIEETLRQARDTAEATTRAKSAFLANMSHEIRTPMNGVIGMSNLLLDTSLNHDQRDLAETVKQSAEALLTILNDILDFSKIEAGRMQFETLDFDLREMVDGTLDLLAARARDKNLAFGALIPHDLPCLVRGDPGRLRQVLLNLLSNALKFTEKGEVFLNVDLQEETESGVRLRFRVSDTGIGLTQEATERLFKPFSQADETTTRRYGGTGLGLAISKQIVELMDGQIGVESVLNEGSTFWFTVLLAKQPAKPDDNNAASLAKLREIPVLVVDHDPTNSKILQHYLGALEMDVRFAPTKDLAVATLEKSCEANGGNHVVIINHYLSEMSGLDLARRLHAQPFGQNLRIVLLISLEQQFPKDELRSAGIACTFSTPIRQSELQYAMLKALQLIQPSNPQHFTSPDIEPEMLGPTLRILVAEDNVVNQRVTTRQLMKLGHKVEVACNGLEVLSTLENSNFDVILMDCQMPELDGYETTRRIRQDPRCASQWVIAMTANAMIGDRETCLEAGMNDYITKPTRIQDLAAALERSKPGQTAKSVLESGNAV